MRFVSPALRQFGRRAIDLASWVAQDTLPASRLQPNPNFLAVGSSKPDLSSFQFVGANSVLSGNVSAKEGCQVYFNSTLKTCGPESKVQLDPKVLVMDHVTIKADDNKSVKVGEGSIISSHSYLHNCTICRGGFVGPRASVSVGGVIEEYGGLAAGSVLEPNTTVPTRQFWGGIPARYLRDITEEDVEYFKGVQRNYYVLGEIYAEESQKPDEVVRAEILERKARDLIQFDFTVEPRENFRPMQESFRMVIDDDDEFKNMSRNEKIRAMNRSRVPDVEMMYDGNLGKSPAYLNELNKDFKLENDIKRKLEYDPEAMRLKKEEFDQPRLQVSDREFKKKY